MTDMVSLQRGFVEPPAQPGIEHSNPETVADALEGARCIVAERLRMAAGIRPGERVLEVVGGSRTTILVCGGQPLHRGGGAVAATHAAAHRGGAGNVRLATHQIEALPFAPGSFDVVICAFGETLTPRSTVPTRELLRVCRRGGRVVLSSWVPGGVVPRLRRVLRKAARRGSVPSRLARDFEPSLAALIEGRAVVTQTRRWFVFHHRMLQRWALGSLAHLVKASPSGMDAHVSEALEAELMAIVRSGRIGRDDELVAAEYMELVAAR